MKSIWIKGSFAVAAIAAALAFNSGRDLLSSLVASISPRFKGIQTEDMGYRKDPESLDLEEEEARDSEGEMISFLDRELQVQRSIASTTTLDLDPKSDAEKAAAQKDNPVQVKLVKKSRK